MKGYGYLAAFAGIEANRESNKNETEEFCVTFIPPAEKQSENQQSENHKSFVEKLNAESDNLKIQILQR